MSSIAVVIYSYKGKTLKDVVSNINENSSKEHVINIYILDQSPLIKNEYYNEISNVSYKHKFWDYPYGQPFYRFETARNTEEEYVLILSDNILLSKNWDLELIKEYKTNSVISGQGVPTITNNNFYLYNNPSHRNTFGLSNFIDKDFIFLSRELFKNTNYPTFLKYNGESEYLSLYWFTRGIEIYSCPSNFYNKSGKNSIDHVYVPYSKDHNYNEVINIIKGQTSKFADLGSKNTVSSFLSYHNINSETLFPLPYQTNDVEYDCYNNTFDKLDGRKFIGHLHYIY